ncbi:LysR family transcriptional regulator [Vibrio sp. SCSIO 43136]|uniref:LysR family transcriptional regulator n=1 Tax=Vibrio sp. SCSIO 43136 TaxID=2819101 RepID=UPI0020755648|nr:LysR family transcriptional regulator [Vibrio sp. SCSIO 43136]USD67855.1 LysR family transcriptional regulator [Vibrio sp. SCSIO 43136]
MTLEQIKAFVLTVESGSFKSAADKLGKHASSISELVSNLEIDTGLELFERKPRSLEITEQGKHLYHYAKPILNEVDLFSARVDNLLGARPSEFSLAIDKLLQGPVLSRCYQILQQTYPGIRLKILIGDTLQVNDWVRSGEVSLGIAMSMLEFNPQLTTHKTFGIEAVRIIGSALPQPKNMDELRRIPQIVHRAFNQPHNSHNQVYSHHVIETNDAEEMVSLIEAGMGWGYVPRKYAETAFERGTIAEFEHLPTGYHSWFTEIIYLSGLEADDAVKTFIAEVNKIDSL